MARYKDKSPISKFSPGPKEAREREDPKSIYGKNPSWSFSGSDHNGPWGICKERLCDDFWDTIFPKLTEFERMTWGDLLIGAKKNNHHVPVEGMNKVAVDRLQELGILEEELLSLRLGGKLRLYGYLSESSYVILWYDDDHGDNNTCVYRSHKKRT